MSKRLRGDRVAGPFGAGRGRTAGAARAVPRGRPAREWLLLLVVFLAAFAVYANTLGHGYAIDDEIFTTSNRFVQQGFAALPDIFAKGSTVGFANVGVALYRPVVLTSLMIEVALWGNSPHVHHLFNVLLFALTASLLYRMLRTALRDQPWPLPLIITLLFVFHPIHTEVVASIKSRDELLAWLFGLLCLERLLDYEWNPRRRVLAASVLSYGLALLSKESSATLVLIAPLLLYTFTRAGARRIAAGVAPLVVVLGGYLIVRAWVLKALLFNAELPVINNTLVAARNPLERLATETLVLGKYLWLLVFPKDLSWDYSYQQIPIVGWGHPAVVLSLLIHLALGGVAIAGLRRRSPYAFAILLYLLMLAPVSNLFFLIGTTMAERFLYVPSLGFCLGLGVLLWRWLGEERVPGRAFGGARLWSVVGVILALYGFRTVERNRDWRDAFSLFSSGVQVSSRSARTHTALGHELEVRGRTAPSPAARLGYLRDARTQYELAVKIYPDDSEAWYNLGVVEVALGDTSAGLRTYGEALRRSPNYALALNNVGTILFARGAFDSAAAYFERSARADTEFAAPLTNLGAVCQQRNDLKRAVWYYDRALRKNPRDRSALDNRRNACLLLGDTVQAMLHDPPGLPFLDGRRAAIQAAAESAAIVVR